MNRDFRSFGLMVARLLFVGLALSIGVGCTVGNNAAPSPGTEPGVDSGLEPIPDAPPGLTIVTPPASQVVAVNSTVSLSAVIDGQVENVEWRKNGNVIEGAKELALTLQNVQLSDSGEYVLKISNVAGSVELKATLTVTSAPVITLRPRAVSAYLGQSTTLSVRATGTGLTYQWFKDGVSVSGQTANSLTLKPVARTSAGTYKVTVSNIAGSVSAQATVAVLGPPVLRKGLSDTTVDVGSPLFLEVDATFDGVDYAWFKDGVKLPGQITSNYTTTAQLADAGKYTVTMTNPAGSVSSSATVTVIDVAPGLAGTYLGLIRDAGGYLNQEYSVTITGRANQAINWTWNLQQNGHCVLLPPTDDWKGGGTIAAGTPAGTEVRHLKFGIYGVNGAATPCSFGPLVLTGSY